MKAKTASLLAQVAAALWITVWASILFSKTIDKITIWDIIIAGLGIAACCSPIYFNIVMDKVKEWKLGKAE